MIPLAIFAVVLFGFMDELFFKLKLYEPDLNNLNISIIDKNPFTDYTVQDPNKSPNMIAKQVRHSLNQECE